MADEEAALTMIEIEIKSPVDDVELIRRRIRDIGGAYIEKRKETDYYYNHPSRDFAVTGEAFRIRVESDTSRITYKGPKLGGIAKSRLEAETEIGDEKIMKEILISLGFSLTGVVSKNREYYEYQDSTITIDNVDGLGTYAEIEMIGEDRELIESEVLDIANKLGIHTFESRSYLAMILGIDD